MSDVDNTDGRGGQDDDADFTSKVIPIADARMRLEQLEPKATPSVNTAVAESSPTSDWPEPDLSVLRLNRRPPPKLPLEVLGDRWAQWVEDAACAAVAPIDYVVAP